MTLAEFCCVAELTLLKDIHLPVAILAAVLSNVALGCTGAAELQTRAVQLRAHAIAALAAPLCGDKLAAEYLLLQMVSRWNFASL